MCSSVKLYGKKERKPRAVKLQAGPLKMLYEQGSLRYISAGGIEIIRMIYPAVRDKDWLTIKPEISRFKIINRTTGFRLSFDCHYRMHEIDFSACYTMEALSEGRLTVEMKGTALSNFSKNRIGFCVLHPADPCSGRPCVIKHPDKSTTTGVFPTAVSPHQPFRNIAGMSWNPEENLAVELRFYGDVFETEDQRNWTDASFKTYCTPLDLSFPVKIKKGYQMHQKIEMTIQERPAMIVPDADERVIFSVTGEELGILPDIGIGTSSRPQPLSPGEGEIIKNIGFSHLRAELFLAKTPVEPQYLRIYTESVKTGLPVELCLFFRNDPVSEIGIFLFIYRHDPLKLKSILLYSENEKTTPYGLIQAVIKIIRSEVGRVPIGAGTNCNFAQLNRMRPDTSVIDFISFAMHPQEHASDNRSLTENAAGQQYAVKTALQFKEHKPVHLSPVTLQRRFNANIENFEISTVCTGLPSQVDPRQMSLFGAAWTVGSLKYLIEAGVRSITYYETVGERGIFMGDYDSRWPMQFQAKKSTLFPSFHVFKTLLQQSNYRVIRCVSNQPLQVDGFAVVSSIYGLIFLSNMTGESQQVEINGIEKFWTLFNMHEKNFKTFSRYGFYEQNPNLLLICAEQGEITLQPCETRVLQFLRK